MQESDAVLEEVVVEVFIQLQQHVQVVIVKSQLVIDQFDLNIFTFAAVLKYLSLFNLMDKWFSRSKASTSHITLLLLQSINLTLLDFLTEIVYLYFI